MIWREWLMATVGDGGKVLRSLNVDAGVVGDGELGTTAVVNGVVGRVDGGVGTAVRIVVAVVVMALEACGLASGSQAGSAGVGFGRTAKSLAIPFCRTISLRLNSDALSAASKSGRCLAIASG